MLNRFYPPGTVYENDRDPRNPAEILGGGTWEAFAPGRTTVGINPSDSDFAEAGQTGGAKTHQLTTAQLPAHNHAQVAHTHTQGGRNYNSIGTSQGTVVRVQGTGGVVEGTATGGSSPSGTQLRETSQSTGNATPTINNTGSGHAHNNLQPYIVTHKWVRVA